MTAEQATPEILMYGADWCHDCRRAKAVFEEKGTNYRYINLEEIPAAADEARAISGRTNIPVIVFPDGSHQVEPSNSELTAKLEELGA